MNREAMIDKITEELMVNTRGYVRDRNKFPIEWDKNNPDSQFAMVAEDIEYALNVLDSLGYVIVKNFNGTVDTGTSSSPSNNIHISNIEGGSSVVTDVVMSVSTTENPTLGNLKEFVERLDRLSIPDDAVIRGRVTKTVYLVDSSADRLECGDCEASDYIVYSVGHTCES